MDALDKVEQAQSKLEQVIFLMEAYALQFLNKPIEVFAKEAKKAHGAMFSIFELAQERLSEVSGTLEEAVTETLHKGGTPHEPTGA